MNAQNWLLAHLQGATRTGRSASRCGASSKAWALSIYKTASACCPRPTIYGDSRSSRTRSTKWRAIPSCKRLRLIVLRDKVIARFKADRDEEYKELLGKCADFEAEIARNRSSALHLRRVGRKRCRSEEAPVLAGKNRQARLLRCHAGRRGSRTAQRLRSLAGRLRATGVRRSR